MLIRPHSKKFQQYVDPTIHPHLHFFASSFAETRITSITRTFGKIEIYGELWTQDIFRFYFCKNIFKNCGISFGLQEYPQKMHHATCGSNCEEGMTLQIILPKILFFACGIIFFLRSLHNFFLCSLHYLFLYLLQFFFFNCSKKKFFARCIIFFPSLAA